jgi:hypothetical protein
VDFVFYSEFILRRDFLNKLPLLSQALIPSVKSARVINRGVILKKEVDLLAIATITTIIEMITLVLPKVFTKSSQKIDRSGIEVDKVFFCAASPLLVTKYQLNCFFINLFYFFNENWHVPLLADNPDYSIDPSFDIPQLAINWWSNKPRIRINWMYFRLKRLYRTWGGLSSNGLVFEFYFNLSKRKKNRYSRVRNLTILLFLNHLKLNSLKLVTKNN